jgi:hypothetical protein
VTTRDQEAQDRGIDLMTTQTGLYARQDRWEVAKALAAIIAAAAIMAGTILALSSYLHPASQQPMFPPGTVITIPGAK